MVSDWLTQALPAFKYGRRCIKLEQEDRPEGGANQSANGKSDHTDINRVVMNNQDLFFTKLQLSARKAKHKCMKQFFINMWLQINLSDCTDLFELCSRCNGGTRNQNHFLMCRKKVGLASQAKGTQLNKWEHNIFGNDTWD